MKDACDMSAQAAICACKQFRVLVFRPLASMELPTESRLLQTFIALLPELRVLRFQTAR